MIFLVFTLEIREIWQNDLVMEYNLRKIPILYAYHIFCPDLTIFHLKSCFQEKV